MYINSREKALGHLDRLAGWQEGKHPAPVTIEWDLSNRCPLGCFMCHFAHTHSRGPWVSKPRILPMAFDAGGDLADTELVKEGIKQLRLAGVQSVVWSGGGEPTTHPDWIEIAEYAQRWGLKQGMYTLGGLLTEETAKRFANVAEWVVVSLDACDKKTYAQDKSVPEARFFNATEGISLLAKHQKAVVGVSFLLHSGNWTRAGEMAAFAKDLGATYSTFRPAIQTSPATPSVCTDDRSWITEAEQLLEFVSQEDGVELDVSRFLAYRDWSTRSYDVCHGIKMSAVITPDGRVWVCTQRRGMQDSSIGDLRKESFSELWNRHTGEWTDFKDCRVMCRLHMMNETLAAVFQPRQHGDFL